MLAGELINMNLEKFPSIIAAFSFAALSVVVAYEWGYFGVVGRDFQSYFTTYDYFSDLIVASGPAFVVMLIIVVVQIALYRKDNFKKPGKPKSIIGKWFDEWSLETIYLVLAITAILFSDQTRLSAFYLLLAFIYIRVANYILSYDALKPHRLQPLGLATVILPAMMIASYGVGRDGAYSDLANLRFEHELRLKNTLASRPIHLLRLLDKGALIVEAGSSTIDFIPKEEIVLLRQALPTWEKRSLACRYWAWGCK